MAGTRVRTVQTRPAAGAHTRPPPGGPELSRARRRCSRFVHVRPTVGSGCLRGQPRRGRTGAIAAWQLVRRRVWTEPDARHAEHDLGLAPRGREALREQTESAQPTLDADASRDGQPWSK